MKDMEYICFQIIASSGIARSNYIDAIKCAKKKQFENAEQLMQEANIEYIEAHKVHASIIQKEANGEDVALSLLLVHAQDQLMSAENFGILAREFIDLYKMI